MQTITPIKLNQYTKAIELSGKEYICESEFMIDFYYDNLHQLKKDLKNGLPHVKYSGSKAKEHTRRWYNSEDCRRWFAGGNVKNEEACL